MFRGGPGLKVIRGIAAKGQKLIVACPAHLVDVKAESRRGRKVVLIPPHRREDYARKHQRSGKAQFVAVHGRRAVFSRLPFIRAF